MITSAKFRLGQGVVDGASVFGIGALGCYGLGLSKVATGNTAFDRSMVWPEYVRQRIRETYLYFGGSLAFTAAGAVAAFMSGVMDLMMTNSWMAILGTMAAMTGTAVVAGYVKKELKLEAQLCSVFESMYVLLRVQRSAVQGRLWSETSRLDGSFRSRWSCTCAPLLLRRAPSSPSCFCDCWSCRRTFCYRRVCSI